MVRLLSLGLFLAVATSCGGAGPSARRIAAQPKLPVVAVAAEPLEPQMGLHPGESMTFTVTLGGVEAGEAQFAVGEPGEVNGREAIVVTSRIATAGVFRMIKDIQDDLTSVVDVESGLPLSFIADVRFPPNDFHAAGRFDGGKVDFEWKKKDGKARQTHYDFKGVDAHDSHSAMAAVRTWDAEPGATRRLVIVGGRRIWQTDVTWGGRETIGTALGNVAAVRLDGVSQRVSRTLKAETGKDPRTFSVWLSDDGDRVPLRVVAHTELGDVVIELTGYERP